jgi:hypothetical protein
VLQLGLIELWQPLAEWAGTNIREYCDFGQTKQLYETYQFMARVANGENLRALVVPARFPRLT